MYNKQNLAQAIFNSGEVQTISSAERVVELVLSELTDAIKSENKVSLAGFGIFRAKDMKAKSARNPKTGEKVKVEAYKKVKFTTAKALKDFVNSK